MTDVGRVRFAGLSAWLALALLVASLVFQVWIGALLLGGGLTIPAWNA